MEERDDGTLVALFRQRGHGRALLRELHAAFGRELPGALRPLPDIDWRRAGATGWARAAIGRLTVTPSWDRAGRPESPPSSSIPRRAFGTGEHGSTRAALPLLDRHLPAGDRVLDLGSGSGILAIAAAKLGAAQATGIDIDDGGGADRRRQRPAQWRVETG